MSPFAVAGMQEAQGLPPLVMDWFEVISKSVAILGGILLAIKAIIELSASTAQRTQDLRWKKANVARELIKEIHADKRAMDAIEMLDWGSGRHEYSPEEGGDVRVGEEDVVRALGKGRPQAVSKKDEFVWESFDWLFYYLDRLEHSIRTGLIDFEDVHDVFRHYADLIQARRQTYDRVITTQDYRLVAPFLDRFRSQPEGPRS